jgi:hypothetical protein
MTIQLIEEVRLGKQTWYAVYANYEFVRGCYNEMEAYAYYEELKEELANPKTYGTNILKEEKIDVNL